MPLAGHPIVIEVSPDDAVWTEVDGLNSVSMGNSRDMLDTTDFKDTSGARTRIAGLFDGTLTFSGDLELSDAGQNQCRSRLFDGAALWVRIKFDPTAGAGFQGYKVKTILETADMNSGVEGKNECNFAAPYNGLPVAV